MYGKNPHQHVRLNLKTQLGPGPRGGPVFSQQRFRVDNPPPPRWSSPMLQRQPNCRNNIPESIGSSNKNLPFSVKNQAFFRNCPPIRNNSSDLSLNNKNFVSKNSPVEFTKYENAQDRQSFSPSDFNSKIVNTKSSSISRSNFLDLKQTSDSPLNSPHEALGFTRNVSVNNDSSAQSPHTNVLSGLERFNSPKKASRSVIPGLDEYADEDEITDEVNSNSSNIVNFNNDEWARHDSIPFLSELNKPSNIGNKDIKYSSQSAMDDYIDELRLEDHKFQEQNLLKNISPENICDELNSKVCKIETPAKSNSSILKSALEQALEILSTKEAVVGLDYIVEYQNNTSSSASLSFSCTLCNSAISRQSIVDHILGGKHRMRYLKIKDEKKHQQILSLNVETEMKEFAISKASFELEKIFGQGTVKVEIKHEDISSPAANIEDNYFSCNPDKVLSFHDIPIVSDNLSFGDKDERIHEFPYDTKESNLPYDGSHKRKADCPVLEPKDKCLPIAEAAVLSTYCPIIKNKQDVSSEHEVVDLGEHIPGSVEKLRFTEEINDTYTAQGGSKKFLRSSPVFLKESSCKQEESNIAQFYDQYGRNKASLSPLFSSSGSQPFTSQETTASSVRKILVEDTRVKRSSSALMNEEENVRKFKKTDIKSEDIGADVFYSESVPRKVLKNDVVFSSELSMHGSSLTNADYDSTSTIVGEELKSGFKSKNDVSRDSDASMLNLEALDASIETPMKLNNNLISTKEICSSDENLEENINLGATILQNLAKCAISTEEEAATVQQAITVLSEIFLKYKLQHLPKDRVELFIKSLHAGQTEDIPKMFQGLKTDEKSDSSQEVYSKEEPEQSVLEHCRTSHVEEVQFSEQNSSYVIQDTSNASSVGIIDNQKPSFLAENNSNIANAYDSTSLYHSLNADKSLQLQQHSDAGIVMTEAAMNIDKGVDNSRYTKAIGTVAPTTTDSASPSLTLAQQTASTESLKPPPFFGRPSTSQSETNQPPKPPPVQTSSPDQTPHRERPPANNWNMSFQTPMHYNSMPYFQMPSVMPHQYHGMPHHQQSYAFPQMYTQSNQHSMYPNMGQHMNQPPLPIGTEMALANPPPPPPPPPPEVRPPLPMQLLSALAVPQPPPPPFPPPPMM